MFTRILAAKRANTEAVRSVLIGLRDQGGRSNWIRHAIEALSVSDGVERVGVWLESEAGTEELASPVVFQGELWERDGGILPLEWMRISNAAPLPQELLSQGKSVEYRAAENDHDMILGPLVGLERALWVPVRGRYSLQGLLLVGTRERNRILPKAKTERVAAELSCLLELEAERRISHQRKADLELSHRIHILPGSDQNFEIALKELAGTCTREEKEDGVGAVFALIGQRQSGLPVPHPAAVADEERLQVCALSGDPAWAFSTAEGRLETLWRQALESGRVEGTDADCLPLAKNISRIVAIPLAGKNKVSGILLAGIPLRADAFQVLERLELRAHLAAHVLEQRRVARAELLLRNRQEALLDSSSESMLLLDRDGFVLGMSHGARKLLKDTDSQNEVGEHRLHFAELFRSRDRETVNNWVNSEFNDHSKNGRAIGKPEMLPAQLRFGMDVHVRPLGISGESLLVVGIQAPQGSALGRGVTEVESELRQTLDWLEEGVLIFDATGGIRAMNTRVQQMLGVNAGEARELRSAEELIRLVSKNAADPRAFSSSWHALDTEGTFQLQEELTMESPIPQILERCARQLVDEWGKRIGRVEVYREMTARRMFQSRMLQTEKLATIGQRAIGIVHELTNPMTTILGNAQRLMLRNTTSAQSSEVRRIFEEAERATSILRQLLYLSRETQSSRQRISVRELLERTAELQNTALAGSTIELRLEFEQLLPAVEGDFAQLQQVLLNLLQNAQQAIEQSGTGRTIGLQASRSGQHHVQLEVWDDGPGISPAIQSRIYDPFFTTKPPGEGTGLGLSIALGFVRQNGGTMTLLSSPRGGTRFVVELPFTDAISTAAEKKKNANSSSHSTLQLEELKDKNDWKSTSSRSIRILVVEDEPTVAALIADVLREKEMSVDVLLDSQSAMRQIGMESYDLLICDLKMPGIDGLTLYRTLLESHHPLSKSVLFVTGDVMAQRSQEFLAQHHLPYVAKPFRVEELSGSVDKMLPRIQAEKNHLAEMNAKHAFEKG